MTSLTNSLSNELQEAQRFLRAAQFLMSEEESKSYELPQLMAAIQSTLDRLETQDADAQFQEIEQWFLDREVCFDSGF